MGLRRSEQGPGTAPPSATAKGRAAPAQSVRVTARLAAETKGAAEFWAARDTDETGERITLNDFIDIAVQNEVARRAGMLVDVDHIMAKRIEQLADAQQALAVQVDAIVKLLETSYSSLLGMARGDHMLTDEVFADVGGSEE